MVSFKIHALLLILNCQLGLAAPFVEHLERDDQPSRILERAAGTQTMSVAATGSASNSNYITPIQVNGQTKWVLLDTGSTKLWIKGNGAGPAFNTSYGTGWAAGNYTTGNVTVGGITITNQTYGLASSWQNQNGIDGILGLRTYPTTYDSTSKTWIANIMPLLKQQRFGVNLPPYPYQGSAVGEITFGYDNTSHQGSPPVYLPIVSTGPSGSPYSWLLNVTSFGVPSGNDTTAVCDLDTGTTDVYVPPSVAAAYWGQVAGAATTDNLKWTFPCDSKLPDFTPTISGTRVVIPGAYSAFANDGRASSTCYSRLQGSKNCILGQSFLYGQYAIYDVQNKVIGLSPRK